MLLTIAILDIDYGIFDQIKSLTSLELMIVVTLFMGLMPVFNRLRALETKINDIQYSVGKLIADVKNLNHTYNYRDIQSNIEKITTVISDVTNFLHKNHNFKIRESNQIKYLDYDP